MTNKKKVNSLESKINNLKEQTKNYRGVYLDVTRFRNEKPKCFRANISNNGEKYSLGYYDNPVDAAKAYNKKAKSLFGSEKKAKSIGRWNVID